MSDIVEVHHRRLSKSCSNGRCGAFYRLRRSKGCASGRARASSSIGSRRYSPTAVDPRRSTASCRFWGRLIKREQDIEAAKRARLVA